jgi:hypothetical protein
MEALASLGMPMGAIETPERSDARPRALRFPFNFFLIERMVA